LLTVQPSYLPAPVHSGDSRTLYAVEGFRFGVEHGFPTVDSDGRFCDFVTSISTELDRVVAEMPARASDSPQLRVGDLSIENQRWYIEGFERFSSTAAVLAAFPFEYSTEFVSLEEMLTSGSTPAHVELQ